MMNFTYEEYNKFVKTSISEEEIDAYEIKYKAGEFSFSPKLLEINFLYSLAIHYIDFFITTNIGRANALFLKEDKYYKPIFYSLKAIDMFRKLDKYPKEYVEIIKRIYTNLGNYYANQFRVYEALECYNNAQFYDLFFGMACANKLLCIEKVEGIKFYVDNAKLFYYLNDEYSVIDTKKLEDGADFFYEKKKYYRTLFCKAINDFKKGKRESPVTNFNILLLDEMESTYSKWVLENCLFLNPLNSIEYAEEAMQDKLNEMYWNLNEEQASLIKQLFEDYIYYRGKIYENKELDSDKKLRECIGTFKEIFSLFDKIAFFLYKYFDLDMKDNDVTFLRVFNGTTKCKNGNKLMNIHNTNLYALYWIKREYRKEDDSLEMHGYMSPDCQELTKLRTKIEHRTTILNETEKYNLIPKTIGLLRIIHNALLYLNALVYQESNPSLYTNNIRNTNLIYLSMSGGDNLFNYCSEHGVE